MITSSADLLAARAAGVKVDFRPREGDDAPVRFFVPMLAGGLGNQLFQAVECVRLARVHGGAAAIDPSLPFTAGQGDPPAAHLGTFFRRLPVTGSEGFATWTEGEPERFNPGRSYVVRGYFQRCPDPGMKAELLSLFRWWLPQRRKAIGLHVRGGDYLARRDLHPEVPWGHYDRAVALLRAEGFGGPAEVHTDDLGYASQRFPDAVRGVFHDLAECEAVVLSNSTWAWWAAWLGEVPRVIYPPRWLNRPHAFNPPG